MKRYILLERMYRYSDFVSTIITPHEFVKIGVMILTTSSNKTLINVILHGFAVIENVNRDLGFKFFKFIKE